MYKGKKIFAITYGDDSFKLSREYNVKSAIRTGKADVTIEYGPECLDENFCKNNESILKQSRGAGYWIWKPYIIYSTLLKMNDGDYLIYSDAGACYVNRISFLIESLEETNQDIMCFSLENIEKIWTKRDAFIMLDCDEPYFTDSRQICAGYILVKKTNYSMKFIKKYLDVIQNEQLLTNADNIMGKENYEGFIEHRHDQSIWSLLCKKEGIKPFRDPSQFGVEVTDTTVLSRSNFPQIIESHRKKDLCHWYQLEYKKWYRWFDKNRTPLWKIRPINLCLALRRKVKRILEKI